MNMNNQSSLKKVKQGVYQYIYVYFKSKGKIIRINTGHRFESKFMNKDLTFNSKRLNFSELNEKTIELKQKVDDYIKFKIQLGDLSTISKDECQKFINDQIPTECLSTAQKTNIQKSVLELLTEFYQYKKDELCDRPSYKDYLSLLNTLTDYQKYHSTFLTLEVINSLEFMVGFRNFLSQRRDGEYLSSGGLNDNTINKRFTNLKSFFRWIENKEIYQFKKHVYNFNVSRYDNNIVVLNKEEIRTLLNTSIPVEKWEKVRDVFVFNCFVGLRYSDLIRLKKTDFIVDEDGDYILFKENKKTNFQVQIPIQKTPLMILKKYNFKLPVLSLQYFNRVLNKLLKEYDLFPEVVVKKRRVNKQIEDFEVPKRDLITTHTCRRTFITLGISNNIPLNSLMLSTGHKRIQTIQFYMKKVLDKNSFEKIDI